MKAEEYIENNLIGASDYSNGYMYEDEIYEAIELERKEERNKIIRLLDEIKDQAIYSKREEMVNEFKRLLNE